MNGLEPMTNNPIIQCIEGVRGYVDADGVVQLNLEDIARGLGFTETKSGKEYVMWRRVNRYLEDFGLSADVPKNVPTGGHDVPQQPGEDLFPTSGERPEYIPEPIFYLLSMKAENKTARDFQRTIAYDVLPAIRKYGFYGTPATIDAVLKDPDFGIRLLSEYKAEKERNLALAAENEAQKQVIADYEPKVQYVDKILKCKGTLAVSQIAADYDMSPQQLNKILHEERVQHKVGDQWILYKEHMGMGFTKSEPIPITLSDGRSDFKLHTKWTQKGRLFIHEKLTKRGIVAVIDRKLAGEQMAI